jgi:hypothetical protein
MIEDGEDTNGEEGAGGEGDERILKDLGREGYR